MRKMWKQNFFASLKSLKKGVGPGSGYISQKCGSGYISQKCGSASFSQRCGSGSISQRCGSGSGSASKCHESPTLQIRHVQHLSLILLGPGEGAGEPDRGGREAAPQLNRHRPPGQA
jgi:hypothetical protein